jgi:iron complex outermembrane receptor protein
VVASKAFLFASTVLVSAALAGGAFAADAAASNPTAVTEVVVTGSRIPKPNLDQATPIEIVTPQILQNTAQTDLGSVLAQLPAMSSQGTVRGNSNSFGNAGGLSYPDLRNLGTQRTLTLVDGMRHVGADPGSTAVDLSSIPPALVDRVEIITGGASAIYGSDAVSGVVNIILKKNFEGVEGGFQGGLLEPGGAGVQYNGNLSVGRNFADGRGNIVVTGLWSKDEGVRAQDLHYLRNYGQIVNPAYITDPDKLYTGVSPTPGDGIPDFVLVPNVVSDFLGPNTILLDANTGAPITSFNKAGQPVAIPTRTGYNSSAFGTLAAPCTGCFATEDYESLETPVERIGGTINLRYDFTPSLRFTMDAKYIRNEVHDFVMPSFSFGDFQLTPDNAFITPQIASLLTGLDAKDYPYISRDMADFGPRTNDITRATYRIVAGLEGKFDLPFAEFKWDGAVNFGTTQNHITAGNDEIPGNFEAALDSVIDPVTHQAACRINVPSMQGPDYAAPAGVINAAGCVPYNPFGQQNTKAALNYSKATTHEYQRMAQEVIDLNSTFDTSRFLNLPGGPITIAFGGEYRKETVADKQDPLTIQGLTDVAATPNFAGGFEVAEGYLEVGLPIIKHKFLIDEFSLDGAVREAHYTSVGNVNAWKISGVYSPVSDFKFRGSYSEAVRAPNLTEGFLPPSGTFFNVTDPCDVSELNVNVNRAANCALQGIKPTFVANANASIEGTISGNSALKPEVSSSYTLGGVFQPRFLRNFSMTIDYYNISIKHAITEVSAQDIVDNCYDSGAGLDPTYCSLFTRAADPDHPDINFIRSTYINASALQTDGLEVQANYGFWADPRHFGVSTHADLPAKISLSFDLNYLMHLRNFPFENDPAQLHIEEGTVGFPQFRFLAEAAYEQGPITVNWTIRYVDKSARFNKDPTQADFAESISPAYVPSALYNDLTVHYRLPTPSGRVELYVGATDIFNVEPAIGVIAGNASGPDGSGLYDFGRYVFAGVRMKY